MARVYGTGKGRGRSKLHDIFHVHTLLCLASCKARATTIEGAAKHEERRAAAHALCRYTRENTSQRNASCGMIVVSSAVPSTQTEQERTYWGCSQP